jgi:2-C-methyl-D-erythritol 4-phosphate cytidylyltransferase
MSEQARCWALIPAAGVGRRFGGEVPKQYLELAGRRVVDHVLDLFLDHPAIAGCVVALDPADAWWPDGPFADDPRVRRVDGGRERCNSVCNGLDGLVAAGDAGADDWVLVHDAARPCLRRRDLDALLAVLDHEPVGALLGIPVHDTVKRVAWRSGSRPTAVPEIVETVPREALWRAYTPQAFRLGLLHRALTRALAEGQMVTDDASAVELLGLRPRFIEGHADNIKITQPEDLPLADFFLRQQGRVD